MSAVRAAFSVPPQPARDRKSTAIATIVNISMRFRKKTADLGLDVDALSDFLADGYLENTPLYAQVYEDGRIVAIP